MLMRTTGGEDPEPRDIRDDLDAAIEKIRDEAKDLSRPATATMIAWALAERADYETMMDAAVRLAVQGRERESMNAILAMIDEVISAMALDRVQSNRSRR